MKLAPNPYAMAAAIAACALTVTPAIAAADEQDRTASVSYSDLDLSTEEGLATLEQRIDRAARQVCELDRTQTGTRIRDRDARNCYNEAKRSFEERFASLIREARLGG